MSGPVLLFPLNPYLPHLLENPTGISQIIPLASEGTIESQQALHHLLGMWANALDEVAPSENSALNKILSHHDFSELADHQDELLHLFQKVPKEKLRAAAEKLASKLAAISSVNSRPNLFQSTEEAAKQVQKVLNLPNKPNTGADQSASVLDLKPFLKAGPGQEPVDETLGEEDLMDLITGPPSKPLLIHKILMEVKDWAESLGYALPQSDLQALFKKLQEYPDYFLLRLSPPYERNEWLLTRMIFVHFNLIPGTSPLRQDAEVIAELKKSSGEAFSPIRLKIVIDGIISIYESDGPQFFPDRFKKLSETDRIQWQQKFEKLPPVFLQAISEYGILRPGMVLLMLNQLGISSTGIPTSATPF